MKPFLAGNAFSCRSAAISPYRTADSCAAIEQEGGCLGIRPRTRMTQAEHRNIRREEFVWALGSFCALNRIPFAPDLVLKEFPPPYTPETLVQAVRALGFKVREMACQAAALPKLKFPCLVLMQGEAEATPANAAANDELATEAAGETDQAPTPLAKRLAIVFEAGAERIVYFEGNSNSPKNATPAEFAALYDGNRDGVTANDARWLLAA